ncbi:hypothetical protein KXD40_000933 [Peronospora effusa]|uniref:Transmembrane protein n=1 Tax=Peronospora effusa TaxID=542832 RepID=A0A3M6VQI2_9STRA|nr:hypothetical protein DD238_005907 [Peronospora effusa]UIZ20295.1 hypothetical protein KXD40_000933 [Peronospora effusa]
MGQQEWLDSQGESLQHEYPLSFVNYNVSFFIALGYHSFFPFLQVYHDRSTVYLKLSKLLTPSHELVEAFMMFLYFHFLCPTSTGFVEGDDRRETCLTRFRVNGVVKLLFELNDTT